MVGFRHAHDNRRDLNEPEIVRSLKGAGYRVKLQDLWDLVVGNPYTDRVCLMEVKHDGGKARGRDYTHGGLTPKQVKLHVDEDWGRFITVVRTIGEALACAEERTGPLR